VPDDIAPARPWRHASYSLPVILVGFVAAATLLSVSGLGLVFGTQVAVALALLALRLMRDNDRPPPSRRPRVPEAT
jgi:hypothetical protein